MNDFIITAIVVISAIAFAIMIVKENIKNSRGEEKIVNGKRVYVPPTSKVKRGIGNLRYLKEFFSFQSTMIILIILGSNFITTSGIDGWKGESLYLLVIIFSVLTSYFLSDNIINLERAIGFGASREKMAILIVAYSIHAYVDFSSLSYGGAGVLNNLTKNEIKDVSGTKVKSTNLVMKNREKMLERIEKQLARNESSLNNMNTVTLQPNKRIATLTQQIAKYEKKGKACPNTRASLAVAIAKQKSQYANQLEAKGEALMTKLDKLTNSYETTSIRADMNKETQIASISSQNETNKRTMSFIAFASISLGLLLGVIYSRLEKEDEVEEVKEEPTLTKLTLSSADRKQELMRSYIIEGMKRTATEDKKELSSDEVATDNLTLSFAVGRTRKHIMEVAVERGGIFSMSKENQQTEVHILQRANSDFRRWLADQAWNRAVG